MRKKLKFKNVHIGKNVITENEHEGTITEIYDIHNIFVEYDGGKGFGIFCLKDDCEKKDILYEK